METLKKNWPLFACTAVIVATLYGCTWSLGQTIVRSMPEVPDHGVRLARMEGHLTAIWNQVWGVEKAVNPEKRRPFRTLDPQEQSELERIGEFDAERRRHTDCAAIPGPNGLTFPCGYVGQGRR